MVKIKTERPETKLVCEAQDEGCLGTSPIMLTWGKPPMTLCIACFKELVKGSTAKLEPKLRKAPADTARSRKAFAKVL